MSFCANPIFDPFCGRSRSWAVFPYMLCIPPRGIDGKGLDHRPSDRAGMDNRKTTQRVLTIRAAALTSLPTATACGSSGNQADVTIAQDMIPHHQQAASSEAGLAQSVGSADHVDGTRDGRAWNAARHPRRCASDRTWSDCTDFSLPSKSLRIRRVKPTIRASCRGPTCPTH